MNIKSVSAPLRAVILSCALLLLGVGAPPAAAQSGRGSAKSPQAVGKTTLEGLLFDLKSPDASRRRDAAETLGEKRVVAAVPELVKLWDDADVEVRRTVVRALGNIGDMRAGATLAKMLGDTDKDVRRLDIKAVLELYAPREGSEVLLAARRVGAFFNPVSDNRDDLVIEPGTPVHADVVPALGTRLLDDDKGVREEAAKALGVLLGKAAVPKMVECAKAEKDKGVLLELLRAFCKIGDVSVGPDLILLVYHDDKAVHDEAIYALGMLRAKEAVRDLTKIYESNVEERRRIFKIIPVSGPDDLQIKTFEALARIAAPESKPLFVAALAHTDARYRQAAAEGLARMADKEQVANVTRLRIRETKEDVRMAQSYALFRMGRREYLEDLIRGVESGNATANAFLLEFSKVEVPLLYPYLESANPEAREKVAEVLGIIGDASALPRLDTLSKDTDSDVMAAAVRATRRINARANQAARGRKGSPTP